MLTRTPSVSLLHLKLTLSDSFYCKYILGVVLPLPGTSLPRRPRMPTATLVKSPWVSCCTRSSVSFLCPEPPSALPASSSSSRCRSKRLDFPGVSAAPSHPRPFAGVFLSLRMLLFLSRPPQTAVLETPWAGRAINSRTCRSQSWRLSSEVREPVWPSAGEGCVPGVQTAASRCVLTWQRGGAFWAPLRSRGSRYGAAPDVISSE